MNCLKNCLGKCFLRLKRLAENYEIEQYKTNFAACGQNVRVGPNCRMSPKHIYVGSDVVIGEASYLMASVSDIHIGSHVVMGPGVIIRGGEIIDLTSLAGISLILKKKTNSRRTIRMFGSMTMYGLDRGLLF